VHVGKPSIFDLGDNGTERLNVEEAKQLLDKVREEDA